jgi:catechol 2,3-dioxygenase-like lactoylglutathione lyase family enzyme
MRVIALDHINIITADLRGTTQFYAEMFDLEPRNAPPPLTPDTAQWMYDDAGRAIIHVNSLDCARAYEREVTPGPTGSIHHIALNCSCYDDVLSRLGARGLAYKLNLIEVVGLRQVFTTDPNGVLLELNFWGD